MCTAVTRLSASAAAKHRRQSGVVLPLLAVGLLAIIGTAGLSIDVGHTFLNKTRLQNSLDAAALSGARTLLLSGDVMAATLDAKATFTEHLAGEMSAVHPERLIVQFSNTLGPFEAGGDSPRFVRAAIQSFPTNLTFSSVLPGVEPIIGIAATAVAGPIPVGYPSVESICDVSPLLMCGMPGDSDCSDGACFGYQLSGQTEYQLKLTTGVDTGEAAAAAGFAFLQSGATACGPGSAFYNCVPAPDGAAEPGRFVVHRLGCTGVACLREMTAGAFGACVSGNTSIHPEPGVSPDPLVEGLMARFPGSQSTLAAGDYPPDVVGTSRVDDPDYWYGSYRQDVSDVIKGEPGAQGGVPYRRVLAVPFVTCSDSAEGLATNAVLGFGCLFLTRHNPASAMDEHVYGQFVDECEASGDQGFQMPGLSAAGNGPLEIVLFKDSASFSS